MLYIYIYIYRYIYIERDHTIFILAFSQTNQVISNTEQLTGKTPVELNKMIIDACRSVELNSDICILPHGIAIDSNFALTYPGEGSSRIY